MKPEYANKSLAQVAYEVYCEARSWKAYDGKPLPQWKDVQDPIRTAWSKSASAVIEAYKGKRDLLNQ
jgi:hypothetical protein